MYIQVKKNQRRERKKKGSLLRLYIKWQPEEIDREQWIPAEAWLYNRDLDMPPRPSPYVFQGSIIDQEGYVADRFRSVIGLIDDAKHDLIFLLIKLSFS